jgi:hypothetical protein
LEQVPPGYIGLLQKLDAVGRAIFGDDWRGAEAPELRQRAEQVDPRRISRAPEPISRLGSPGHGGSQGRRWSIWDDPERLADAQHRWEELKRLATEAENQRSQAISEMQRRFYGTPPEFANAVPVYEKLPDGSLSPIPRHHWYGDAAAYVFRTGETENGRPVLIPDPAARLEASAAGSILTETPYAFPPGPKGGERSVDQLAWRIALTILGDERKRPTRRHGWKTALARMVNVELAKQGHQRQGDSVRKAISRSLRDWEAKNPDK